jgi:hypothetical protein
LFVYLYHNEHNQTDVDDVGLTGHHFHIHTEVDDEEGGCYQSTKEHANHCNTDHHQEGGGILFDQVHVQRDENGDARPVPGEVRHLTGVGRYQGDLARKKYFDNIKRVKLVQPPRAQSNIVGRE